MIDIIHFQRQFVNNKFVQHVSSLHHAIQITEAIAEPYLCQDLLPQKSVLRWGVFVIDSNLPVLDQESAERPVEPQISETAPDSETVSDVELKVEKTDRRQRKIQARIQLPYPPEKVWSVLTNYEALSDFIPNLASSSYCEHPDGGIRIEQVGTQSALMLKFSARVVLDMEENFPEQIRFNMVEGDFKEFRGDWTLAPQENTDTPTTELTYSVQIWPKRSMPIIAVEKRLSKDLPTNLIAIRQRLDELF